MTRIAQSKATTSERHEGGVSSRIRRQEQQLEKAMEEGDITKVANIKSELAVLRRKQVNAQGLGSKFARQYARLRAAEEDGDEVLAAKIRRDLAQSRCQKQVKSSGMNFAFHQCKRNAVEGSDPNPYKTAMYVVGLRTRRGKAPVGKDYL